MFDIARTLHASGNLDKIVAGYPKNRLNGENLPAEKIETHPLFQIATFALIRMRFRTFGFGKVIDDVNLRYLDRKTKKQIGNSNLIAMSSLALETARLVKSRGNTFILNRSSHHIISQREILVDLANLWGWTEPLPSQASIDRELEEYQLADKIIVPSKASYNSFQNREIAMSKVFINPFPLTNVQIYNSSLIRKDILFVGNVTLQKGFPTLVQAFNSLNISGLKLHIVGIYSRNFIDFLKKQGLRFDNVVIYGPLDSKRLNKLWATCDVFVLPSIHDGWGMVVNEAMAHGCIPIVSSGVGASDQIVHGINGLIFEAGDTEELAECILKAIGNEELRITMNTMMLSSPYFKRTWNDFCRIYFE
jgi:glycosyltransferase involved in cell wall biosynthesis